MSNEGSGASGPAIPGSEQDERARAAAWAAIAEAWAQLARVWAAMVPQGPGGWPGTAIA